MINTAQDTLQEQRGHLGNQDASPIKDNKGIGQLPLFSLIASIGLLIIAIADNSAREGLAWGNVLYWIGLLVIFVPLSARILTPNISREERLGLVLILGLSLYLVKIFYSPLEYKYPDELQHWRTENDILQFDHLFTDNPSLPVSPFYPGLQIVTNALIQLTGLSIFNAGVFVIGIARCILTLALYLFYEKVSLSSRVAGIASVLYMVNPHYLFINSFFIYQTLAVSLMSFGLYAIAQGEQTIANSKIGMRIVLLLALTSVIVTHHVTSYAFLLFLVLWLIAAFIIRLKQSKQVLPIWIVLLAVVGNLTWSIFVATSTFDYFKLPFIGVIQDVLSLISQENSLNGVFHAPTGPIIERLINLSAVGLIALSLLPTILIAWKRYCHKPIALSLIIGSLGYFGSLLVRIISSQGAELAGRSWSFIFIPVAFVLAVGIREALKRWLDNRKPYIVFTVLIVFIFVGGIMGGEPAYYERLPGPYLGGSYMRAIEPQGVAAAKWLDTHLGPNNRIASDFTNYTLMGTYGEQDPVRGVYSIFYSLGRDSQGIKEIQNYSVRYLVVDYRLALTVPASGRYFDIVDPHSYHLTNPINPAALTKFDNWDDINRIFDSGDIVIYDLKAISIVQ